MVASFLVIHHRAAYTEERFERQLVMSGERLSIQQLLPTFVPPSSNGAWALTAAMGAWRSYTNLLAKNPPHAMRLIAPGVALVGWAEPDIRYSKGTNSWAEIESDLAQWSAVLDSIREATQKPVLDFNLNYQIGFSLLLPHLAPLKQSVTCLSSAVLCDLHDGNSEAAAKDIEVMLQLVRGIADEKLVISQLVRIAMAHIAIAATWELLQAPGLTDAQLAPIQRDWQDLSFMQPMEHGVEMERAMAQMMIERMRASPAEFRQALQLGGGRPSSTFSFGQAADDLWRDAVVSTERARWQLALSYPDQLRALKGDQVILESLRGLQIGQSFCETIRSQQAGLAQLGLRVTNSPGESFFDPDMHLDSLFSSSLVSLSRVSNRLFLVEAARRLTVTALALKRYHLQYQQYPPDLASLTPQFVAAVPCDPADGKPLRYRRNSDGSFLLYSIGEDGRDDGGDGSSAEKSSTPGWQKGRDWVWPRTATPQEAAAFRRTDARAGR